MMHALASTLLCLTAPALAVWEERDVETVLSELEAAEAAFVEQQAAEPQPDRSRASDPAYRAEFQAERERHYDKVVELAGTFSDRIGELYDLQPTHERLTKTLPFRWDFETQVRGRLRQVIAETGRALEQDVVGANVATEAQYWRAIAMSRQLARGDDAPFERSDVVAAGRTFWTEHPDDPRAPGLIYELAESAEIASTEQKSLLRELVQRYPRTREAARAKSLLGVVERVGQPVELAFEDAITGEEISIAGLAGNVVVLDFWATWCGPCVAEMPHMKELYAEYHPQGVEFLGISLDAPEDEGGLRKLRAFVEQHEIPWPQYYQGNGWESAFSRSWGISSIPAVFVIDQQGNLYHPRARGKLEELLPELLAVEE